MTERSCASKMEGPRPDKFAFVERSRTMKAPVGLLSDRTVLRSKMEGPCPDKRYPNKITSEMQTHCRSEVPDGQEIFKN